jgi:hypothetical protein
MKQWDGGAQAGEQGRVKRSVMEIKRLSIENAFHRHRRLKAGVGAPGRQRQSGVRWVLVLAVLGVTVAGSTVAAQSTECNDGQSVTEDTDGHCCWSGQAWSRLHSICVGVPECPVHFEAAGQVCRRVSCEAGFTLAAAGCVRVCDGGRQASLETQGNCCWPGQSWSVERRACTGVPTACPDGLSAQGEDCATPCALGLEISIDTAGHCCWPGQVWSGSRDVCIGVPTSCPSEMEVVGERCAHRGRMCESGVVWSETSGCTPRPTAELTPRSVEPRAAVRQPPVGLEPFVALVGRPSGETQRAWWRDEVPVERLGRTTDGDSYRSIRVASIASSADLGFVARCQGDQGSYAVQTFRDGMLVRVTLLIAPGCAAENARVVVPGHWGTVVVSLQVGYRQFAYRVDFVLDGSVGSPPAAGTERRDGRGVAAGSSEDSRRVSGRDGRPQPSSRGDSGSGDSVRVNFVTHLPRAVFPRRDGLLMRALLITLSLLVAGCPPPVCLTGATRCDGERVEACDGRGQWRLVADCVDVARSSGGEWTCGEAYDDGRHVNACMPAEAP